MPAKYVIGIDLGTTNSVLAYIPLEGEQAEISLLEIPQMIAPSTIENRTALPSFLYFSTEEEKLDCLRNLGTEISFLDSKIILGEYARKRSAEVPDRIVVAAKSWLANRRVDRHQAILPWESASDFPKISPVQASQYYLEYLVATWNNAFPENPIQDQNVVLTVPASFDESARELTREAAFAAGLSQETIFLEEPQAAIYSWLATVGDDWRKRLGVNDVLLVCDVGGGTTDLSLVRVEEENGEFFLRRLAVGNHLLIGGDNMDLALAYQAAELFSEKGMTLNPWQSISLWHSCRTAKETLLQSSNTITDSKDSYKLSILGRSKRLIGGTVSVDFPKSQILETIFNGFFPLCDLSDRPKRRSSIGVRELGLPFEPETGITKHIAAFLQNQKQSSAISTDQIRPTHYLLNGGVFKATALQQRLKEQFLHWFPDFPPQNLFEETDLDHSVAKGAAYYAWTKQHNGVRIRGSLARSYYVGIESAGLAIPGMSRPLKALCVAPIGMEEGTSCQVPSTEFGLIVGEPAVFRFFSSTTRRNDRPGALLDQSLIDSFNDSENENIDLTETDPIETTLTAESAYSASSEDISSSRTNASPETFDQEDEYVPVHFQTNITELGVLEIWCKDTQSDRRWKLEFSVRESNDVN
ncbi:MAG: Hsp70 family protein [Planctomycetia bacterium]|nr:Hsp70 family protein [Planctomycetia bacterium]